MKTLLIIIAVIFLLFCMGLMAFAIIGLLDMILETLFDISLADMIKDLGKGSSDGRGK